ncbi:hypothetical protein PVAP13_3NG140401 [Panicum virgatum]|uniref:Uncharacterized protein n=1 Tax=Panicum virgatum TaxID=38727 RepID=A0A8T0UCL9_PANVG|nr:hypothetical protein PVAP13_3NG140401 [Panicum virgatum]
MCSSFFLDELRLRSRRAWQVQASRQSATSPSRPSTCGSFLRGGTVREENVNFLREDATLRC